MGVTLTILGLFICSNNQLAKFCMKYSFDSITNLQNFKIN